MINPTHFIEVYKGTYTNTMHQSKVLDIDLLNKLLCSNLNSGLLKTIAVWKIKFKENEK